MYSYRITVESKIMKSLSRKLFHRVIAIAGLAFISSGSSAFAQQAQSQVMNTTTSDTEQAPQLASGELDSLVAPIALYPDPLLAQTLAGQSAGGRCGKAAVGPKRPVTCRVSRRGAADGRQYSMDHRLGKRIPGAAIRRDGRSPAYASKSPGHRKSKD